MPIDIDNLTEAELTDLNHRVVARLKFLHQSRAHAHMLDYRISEKVSFQPDGHPLLSGILSKYNRKTVTVITEDRQQWNVAPVFLRKGVRSRKGFLRTPNHILNTAFHDSQTLPG